MDYVSKLKDRLKSTTTTEDHSDDSEFVKNLRNRVERAKNPLLQVDSDYVNSFLSDSGKYFSNYESDYNNLSHSNSSSTYNSWYSKRKSLLDRSNAIRAYYNENKENIDEKQYNDIISYLDSFESDSSKVIDSFYDASRFYSQFETEDEYNKAVNEAKDYQEKLSFDLDAGQEEIEKLREANEKIDKAVSQAQRDQSLKLKYNDYYSAYKRAGYSDSKAKELANNAVKSNQKVNDKIDADAAAPYLEGTGYNTIQELKDALSSKTEYYNSAFEVQKYDKAINMKDDELVKAIENARANKDTDDEIYYQRILDSRNETDDDSTLKNVFDYAGGAAYQGLKQWNHAITSTLDVLLGKPLQALGWENNPISSTADYYDREYKLGQYQQEKNINALGGGTGLELGSQAIESTVAAIPDLLLALMSGGTSTAASSSALASKAAYESSSILGKAGITASNMMKNPTYWLSFARELGPDYEEAIESGASETVAGLTSTITALINAGIEIGIDGASGIQGIPDAVKNGDSSATRQWVKSLVEEGNEEVLQGMVERTIANITYDDKPMFSLGGDGVIDPLTSAQEWAMGAAVGGILGGSTIGVNKGANAIYKGINAIDNTVQQNRFYNNQGMNIIESDNVQKLVNDAKELGDSRTAKKLQALADEIAGVDTTSDSFTEDAKKSLAKKTGKLYRGVMEQQAKRITESNRVAIESEIKSELESKGVEDVDNATKLLTKYAYGKTLSKSENAIFEKVGGKDVVDTVLHSEMTKETKELVKKGNETSALPIISRSETELGRTIDIDVDDRISDDGNTRISSTGEEITIDKNNAIKYSKGGEVYLNTDRGEVELSDIEFGTESEALLYEGFSDMSPAIASALIKNYDGKTPIKSYINGMRQGVNVYGKYNFQGVGTDISSESYFAELSDSDQQLALKMGRSFANTEMKKTSKSQGKVSVKKGTGTVRFENGVKATTQMQKNGVSLAKHLASALGVDIVFFNSETDPEHSGDNGWFDPVTNTIHIDINAGDNNNQTIAYTLGHELTHFIKAWSPAKFKVFGDFLIEQYGKHGFNTQEMLEAQMAKNGTDDVDVAYEELVADACQTMLLDSNAMEKLMMLRQQDETLWDKIKEFVKKFLDNIRYLYKGIDPDSEEANSLRSMKDVAEQLYSMFADAAVDATKAYQSADTSTIRGSQYGFVVKNNVTGTGSLTGTVKSTKTERVAMPKMIMALSSGSDGKLVTDIPGLTATMIDGVVKGNAVNGYTVAQIRDSVMEENGYTSSQIKRMQAFMQSMSKFMDDAGVKYRFIGLKDVEDAKLHYSYNKDGSIKSIVLSAMVKNGDYPVNFDFSSICKKRVAMSRLINKLCKSGSIDSGTVNLSPKNIFEINKALKDAGYETACLGCFVESKRYNVQEWARTFIEKWNSAVIKVNPNATYFGFTDGKTDFDNITGQQAVAIDNAANEFLRKTGKERRDKAKAVYQEKANNGDTLLEKLPKTAINKINNSTTLDDGMKEYFLNTDPSKFTLDDVYLLIDNDIIAGRSISNKQKITKMVESGEQFQHLLRPSDLLTEKGISQLEQLPNFHGILYGHYGSGTPKLVQGFTPYNSEIALLADKKGDKTLSEYLYSIAGVRMQSFSDFQIQNIFDYLQMIADLSARKLPAHAYTKEIAFAKLLGMTGIKTNLSVMFDIDTSVDDAHAGLTKYNPAIHHGEYAKIVLEDEQGKWVYNIGDYATQKAYENYDRLMGNEPVKRFLQSIGFADAVKLQTTEGYTKNCGIIGVGYSDLHILAMLDDPRIRYIIPYHASSLPQEIKIATNIKKAIDYTSTQNTMKITSITDKNGKAVDWSIKEAYKRLKSGKAVVEELNKHIKEDGWKVETKKAQNGHGTFDLYGDLAVTSDPRATAENFMSWCAKNGSLPMFYQFADHKNYYKLLYDFNVYDNVTEEYAPQQAVTNTYPTEDGAGANVVDGNFNEELFQNMIDGYMRFQNSFNEGLDSTLDEIAGKITSNTLPGADFSIGVKKSVKNNAESKESALTESQQEYFTDNNDPTSNTDIRYSKRTKPAPNNTQEVYKLMRLKDGKLYPLFIDITEPIDVGVWYDADSPNMDFLRKMPSGIFIVDTENQSYQSFEDYLKESGEKKTKLPSKDAIEKAASNGTRWVYIEDTAKGQKRFGGETRKYWNLGINGSGAVSTFSMRPGYHAGSLPSMRQIGKGANRDLRDDTFVWTVGEVPADIDYQEEANRNPDKDIPTHIPVDGYYLKATNADKAKSQADVIGWYVAGSYKVNRIIGDVEARQIIDDWNANHPDAQAMYDYDRESGMDFDADQMKLVPKNDVMYSKKNKSNREILAEALDTTIDTSTQEGQNQAKLLADYTGKIEELDKLQKHLSEVNAEIKEISFSKGKRDADRLRVLNDDKIKTTNRINFYDKKLLSIEAQKPIKELLERERESINKRYASKGRELAKKKVSEKTESISKKVARDKLHKLIFSTTSWLTHPSKTDVKCPDFIKAPYKEFLDCIDTSSKRLLKGGEATKADMKFAMAMDSLANAIEKIKDSQNPEKDIDGDNTDNVVAGYLDLPASFVKELRDTADNIKKMMVEGDYVINTMTSNEIKDLYNKIRQLNKSIKEMEKMYMNARFANVQELGRKTVSDAESLGEIKNDTKLKAALIWDNALPYYAFKRFGEGGVSIFEELMDAQDKLAFLSREIFEFKEKNWTDKEVKEWSEDTHTIKLPSGVSITLTSADAMSIYCLARREQAIGHLFGGGIRVIGIEKNGKKAQDSRANLSNEDILAICKSLTEKQETVAKAIQEFMSTVCAKWGNEIWMKRFLTNIFTERFYFPIESNDENMVAKDPERKQSDLFRLLNISATKPLTEGANNEIIIRNIFDVFASHSSDMAKLNAFGMALLDTMKWFNYMEKTTNEKGQLKVKGVRKAFNTAFGSEANKYIMQLIKDINGTAGDTKENSFVMKMIRGSKTASVGNNLRVAFLQMTALPRARLILSDSSIAKAITRKPQIAKAEKYCGIALWKSFGFYDTNITKSVESQIKGAGSALDKVIEFSLKGPELGDKITWGYLWNACEYEVMKKGGYSVGTEEFNQAVAKKLREVVYSTQVVDSILTRTQSMRKKSGLNQMITAFGSEGLLSYNILLDAQWQVKKRGWNNAGKYFGRAVSAYMITQLLAAIAEGLFDSLRDDDDDDFVDKMLDNTWKNAVQDILVLGKVPVIKDIENLVLSKLGIGFFNSDRMDNAYLSTLGDAYDVWAELINKGDDSSKTVYNALYKTVTSLSKLTGIPISNAMREVVTLWNNTVGAFDYTKKIRLYDVSDTETGENLYNALVKGDSEKVENLKKYFSEEDDYASAVKSAIKSHYESGDIDSDTAEKYLIDFCGMDSDKAYWQMDRWKYIKENGSSDDYSKYDDFHIAVETGSNIKAVIKEYTDNGVEEETLASEITRHFKPIYIDMSNSDRSRIKGYLLNAYEILGYDRKKKSKEIDRWVSKSK